MSLRIFALLFFTFLLFVPSEAAEPALTKTEAIKLASEAAKKEGFDLSTYAEPTAKFNPDKPNGRWFVFYQGKSDKDGRVTFGHHFGVFIDAKTLEVRISRGR